MIHHSERHLDETVAQRIYGKWRPTIMKCYLFGWVLVTLFEIAMHPIESYFDDVSVDTAEYYLFYVLVPASINLAAILATFACMVTDKLSGPTKNYLMLTMFVVIATVLSTVHAYYAILPAAFLLPVLASTVFQELRYLLFATAAAFVGLCISFGLSPFYVNDWDGGLRLMNTVCSFVMLLVGALVGFVMILIHHDREDTLSAARRDNRRLEREVRFDGLTGLLNHTCFYQELEGHLAKARETGRGFCVAMIDIDNFKLVNDTLGHGKGDEVLRMVAVVLQDHAQGTGLAFRYGGDEFALVFDPCDAADAEAVVESIRQEITTIQSHFPGSIHTSISAGLYEVNDFTLNAEQVFYLADQALYQAKFSGKNRCVRARA